MKVKDKYLDFTCEADYKIVEIRSFNKDTKIYPVHKKVKGCVGHRITGKNMHDENIYIYSIVNEDQEYAAKLIVIDHRGSAIE